MNAPLSSRYHLKPESGGILGQVIILPLPLHPSLKSGGPIRSLSVVIAVDPPPLRAFNRHPLFSPQCLRLIYHSSEHARSSRVVGTPRHLTLVKPSRIYRIQPPPPPASSLQRASNFSVPPSSSRAEGILCYSAPLCSLHRHHRVCSRDGGFELRVRHRLILFRC